MTAEIENRTFLREFTIDFLSGMSGGDDPSLEYVQYCRYIYAIPIDGGGGAGLRQSAGQRGGAGGVALAGAALPGAARPPARHVEV